MTIEDAADRILARWPTWSRGPILDTVSFSDPRLLLTCTVWPGRGWCEAERRHRDGWFARFGVDCGDGIADGLVDAEQWHWAGPCEAVITAARQVRSALNGAIEDIDAKVLQPAPEEAPQ
jgi:hypothetical protein